MSQFEIDKIRKQSLLVVFTFKSYCLILHTQFYTLQAQRVEEERDKIRTREREGGSLSYRENINRPEWCYGNGFAMMLLYVVLRYALFGSSTWKASDGAAYRLEACDCSPSAMRTGWQSCSCTPRGCPLASPPAGRATDSVPPPLVWTGHCAPVPVLSERWAQGKPPHSPCSDRGCCPIVVWSGSLTPQMSPWVFQSDCCCPGPGRPAWKRCWESPVLCGRGNCSGGPGRPSHCTELGSPRGCGESSCRPAKASAHPGGSHRVDGSALGQCSPQCGDPGTGRLLGSFPPGSIRQRRARWG